MGNAIAPALLGFRLGSPPWNLIANSEECQFLFPTSQGYSSQEGISAFARERNKVVDETR
jgi:hypothetical protein